MNVDSPAGVLHARDVHKSYSGTVALRGVSLSVEAGRIRALLGPNGAGKTTLITIAAGLRRPDAGSVTIDGIDVGDDPRATHRRLGLAPQELGLYPVLTVADNFEFFGRIAGLRGSELARRILDLAEIFGLGGLLGRIAGTLSGGEKRRLHTAVALLHEPPLVILDEPTSGADPTMRRDLLALVARLAAEGTAVCYSTHYLSEVESLDAEITVIDRGLVVAEGSREQLIAAHTGPGSNVEATLDGVFEALTTAGEGELEVELDGAARL